MYGKPLPMQRNPNCNKPFKPPRRYGQPQPPIGDENAGRNDSPAKDSPPKLHGSPKGPLQPSNEAAPSVATTSAAPSAEAFSRHLPATMNSRLRAAIAEMSSDGEANQMVARVPPNLTSLPPGQSTSKRFFTIEGVKITNPCVERLGAGPQTDRRKRATVPYLRGPDGQGAWLIETVNVDAGSTWTLAEPDRFPKAAPHPRRNSDGEATRGHILAKETARDGQGCACVGLAGRPCQAELGGDYFGTTLKPSAFGVDHIKVPSILSKTQKRVATQEVDSGLAQFLCCYCAADKQACMAGPEGSAKHFKPLV